MNKRIRKKRLAQHDRRIADALRLYATRPRGTEYEEIARGLLGLQIGLALYSRLQLVRGPRYGWGCSPPDEMTVEQTDARTLSARGSLRLFPPGEDDEIRECFRLQAESRRGRWQHVLFTWGDDSPLGSASANQSLHRTSR